jgi:hypothetical protein
MRKERVAHSQKWAQKQEDPENIEERVRSLAK